jgi:flavin reductase (DIM6/NTAB) family NADH-FMN oxidoreductase RutF
MLADDFKQAFSVLAAGVSVVTFEVAGQVHGFTATSLTAVSMEPPLALFCVGRGNTSHAFLNKGTAVGISILAAEQQALSHRFATKVALGGYVDVDVTAGDEGAPVLRGAVAVMTARIVELVPAGDHTIYVCRLQWAHASSQRRPLLYCARNYHTLAPLSP